MKPQISEKLKKKLADLPKTPGVYFHKDKTGEIIYVGKAAILRNRVRQYFQASRARDPKTEALVAEIVDTDWMEVESEIEALFLEAEMVRRYMPRYNILLRDDKSNSYVRIDMQSDYPSVTMTRRPLDDGAQYFGPYLSAFSIKRALKYLRKIFPYSIHTMLPSRGCLQYHLGLCPGPETGQLDSTEYKKTLRKLIMYLKGERSRLISQLEKEMNQYAKAGKYEQAAEARDQLRALKELNRQIIFSDKEFQDLSKDHALNDLSDLLGLEKLPKRIEGYDISHMQGTDTVASMVVFTNGVSDKGSYRKFKMRIPGNDDFAHMNEVITRRFSEKNVKAWGLPNLLLIDGGKGQLGAAVKALQDYGSRIPAIGLAKQFEQIIVQKSESRSQNPEENASGSNVAVNLAKLRSLKGTYIESDDFITINLPDSSHIVKLLQRIRDESHRFAVSYHTTLKRNRQTTSLLDDIPTIGPETRKKLLRTFGSMRGVMQARDMELEKLLGVKKAALLRQYLRAEKKTQTKQ